MRMAISNSHKNRRQTITWRTARSAAKNTRHWLSSSDLLDIAPVANVDVDVRHIFAEADRRQRLQTRRWRRVAYVALSAAAALLIAFFLQFEARWEGRQLVVRFGVPSAELAEGRPDEVPDEVKDKQPRRPARSHRRRSALGEGFGA